MAALSAPREHAAPQGSPLSASPPPQMTHPRPGPARATRSWARHGSLEPRATLGGAPAPKARAHPSATWLWQQTQAASSSILLRPLPPHPTPPHPGSLGWAASPSLSCSLCPASYPRGVPAGWPWRSVQAHTATGICWHEFQTYIHLPDTRTPFELTSPEVTFRMLCTQGVHVFSSNTAHGYFLHNTNHLAEGRLAMETCASTPNTYAILLSLILEVL